MSRAMMIPREVLVHWSEAGDALAPDDTTLPFAVFEMRARRVAMSHKTGGYLKTKITVIFDDPEADEGVSRYQCRIDLAEHDEKGFQDGIEKRIEFMRTQRNGRMAGWPADMVADHERLLRDWWSRMDFAAAQAPAPQAAPVPYRCDLTSAGEQFVFPGCERDAVPHSGARQMSLF